MTTKKLDKQLHPLMHKTLITALALAASGWAAAVQPAPQDKPDDVKTTRLDKVVVQGETHDVGEVKLDMKYLERLPTTTGTVTDALRGQSFITFDRFSRASDKGAEVAAPLISINGSRPYENNYSIDGLDNNNTLNPGSWTDGPTWAYLDPRGDSQSFMLQTELLEAIDVYSENVPVKYGDFTGGVVDTKLRDAKADSWHGAVSVRHTDADWARQHLVGGGDPLENDFKRTQYNARIEGPLNDGKLGVILAVTRHQGTTDKRISKKQPIARRARRTNDNVMLKVHTRQNDDFSVAGTLLYAPYEADDYLGELRDSHFTLNGGGLKGMLNVRKRFNAVEWTTAASYGFNEVSRKADANVMRIWKNKPGGELSSYANWFPTGSYCKEGLYGDSERKQYTLNVRSELNFDEVTWLGMDHKFMLGMDLKDHRISYDREGWTMYKVWSSDRNRYPNVIGDISDGVVAGEQFAREKKIEDGRLVKVSSLNLGAYVQDNIRIKRLRVRPGLRFSWDNISHNFNTAPRLMFDLDVLDNGRFNVNAGWNRYYGTQIIGNYFSTKMHSAQTYRRNLIKGASGRIEMTPLDPSGVPDPWTPYSENGRVLRDYGSLKTPFSDEWAVGATAEIFNGFSLGIKGVKRDYKDQLTIKKVSPKTGYDSVVTNGGGSHYKGLTVTMSDSFDLGWFGTHTGSLGFTTSRVSGSDTKMIAAWDKDSIENYDPDYVLIDGVKTARDKIPASNFNPDWVLTYTHGANFWHERIRTTWLFRLQDKCDHLVKAKPSSVDGMENFETVQQPRSWDLDLNAQVDLYKRGDVTVTMDVQVSNLFDRMNFMYKRNKVNRDGSVSGFYKMGRQYYVGLKATF